MHAKAQISDVKTILESVSKASFGIKLIVSLSIKALVEMDKKFYFYLLYDILSAIPKSEILTFPSESIKQF